MDPKLDLVASASFCRIRIVIGSGIQGVPIRIRIAVNFLLFS
jgi:hypothetical protein